MLEQYGLIAILAIIAIAFPFIGVGASWLLRPKRPDQIKNSIYECGMETIGETSRAVLSFRLDFCGV